MADLAEETALLLLSDKKWGPLSTRAEQLAAGDVVPAGVTERDGCR